MPWFKGFRATTLRRAFILNSIAAAMVASIAVLVKDRMDANYPKLRYQDKFYAVFIVSFISSIVVYVVLYRLFGFGASMLVGKI